jgi:chromate reductase, NAD(P)H dehydrogenase (quinone)
MTASPPQQPRLLFFAGSQREKSWNKRVARAGAEIAKANGIDATFADLADYDMPLYNGDIEAKSGAPDGAHKFKSLLEAHHGVFIISPEYNASFSPLLKNTLDWVSHIREPDKPPMQVFKTRVFALGSASSGGMGGLRGLSQLRIVLELGLNALVLPDQFAVPRVNEAFDEIGAFKNKDQSETYKTIILKLAKTAKALQSA